MDGQNILARQLDAIHFGPVTVKAQGDENLIAVELSLGDVSPDKVRVELYADSDNDGDAVEKEMMGTLQQGNAAGGYIYRATVPSARPATDFTARITANRDSLAHDLEAGWMLWQK
jgi:starch phosphorylase